MRLGLATAHSWTDRRHCKIQWYKWDHSFPIKYLSKFDEHICDAQIPHTAEIAQELWPTGRDGAVGRQRTLLLGRDRISRRMKLSLISMIYSWFSYQAQPTSEKARTVELSYTSRARKSHEHQIFRRWRSDSFWRLWLQEMNSRSWQICCRKDSRNGLLHRPPDPKLILLRQDEDSNLGETSTIKKLSLFL